MKKNEGRKKRQLKRIRFEQDIEVVGGKNGRSTQLGIRGMYLTTDVEIPMGKTLSLRFKLTDNDPTFITVDGRVVYVHPGKGVGIEFKNLPWKDLEKISDYIEDKPEDD